MKIEDNFCFKSGYAYFLSMGAALNDDPKYNFDTVAWMNGFCTALAGSYSRSEFNSIEQALLFTHVEEGLIDDLLLAAEKLLQNESPYWSSIPLSKFSY